MTTIVISTSEGTNTVSTPDQPRTNIAIAGNVGPAGPAGPTANYITATDMEVTNATKGYILKSPNGTRFRLTVSNDGTIDVTVV